jgi:hypothetical protein
MFKSIDNTAGKRQASAVSPLRLSKENLSVKSFYSFFGQGDHPNEKDLTTLFCEHLRESTRKYELKETGFPWHHVMQEFHKMRELSAFDSMQINFQA